MDYMKFVDYHRTSNADITIGCIAYDEERASDFGLMKVRQHHPLSKAGSRPRPEMATQNSHE
jgi:glucose-1-phosphate adenylyltransferase